MAFTNTHMRSASFGIVTSLPDDIIDSFWYIIDHFLKNVFELEEHHTSYGSVVLISDG
ncbi:Staphylococcal protein of uncharacterised function (DUF960) [Streptococcus pneumoniae]|nr:Staphylococcal protein of uncharacterised function (DUF960) [Streptococcus pneumoniae]